MQLEDFKRILTAFADNEADLDFSKGTLLVQVRDELIEARLYQHGGQLIVDEEGQRLPAFNWVVNRIARVPLLADRILSYVPETAGFVTPSGHLLDQPDFARTSDEGPHADAMVCALEVLGRRTAGTTSVLYLTSDAGEGKTTLINHLSRYQATEFKAKRSDWLLVPIPLGGRSFLRFDDVVVAALVNRLRFQLLYYDSFLELVRLGVIVPAFDGFEEMIISSSSGEAISALGNLVRSLSSSGSVLVAARKAYFDYQSFKAQARLFDAIGTDSVAFARLSLDRWNRDQFLAYATKRGLQSASAVYSAVADRLRDDDHPLLTRAVLVRRLVDVASASTGLSDLLDQIGSAPQHYFFQFVNAIVEREANEKWIDQSGEPHQSLLTVEEHHELLGMVAQEMWLSATDSLRADVLAAIAEVFAESRKKPPVVARQIRERLKQHSLLVSGGSAGALAFDHEDFRAFYLGEAVGRAMAKRSQSDLKSLLQSGQLPRAAVEEAVLHVRRLSADIPAALATLQDLATAETGSSLVRENCGALAIGMAEETPGVALKDMSFPEDALRGRSLSGFAIRDSYFQASSLAGTRLTDCLFHNCRFERLEVHADTQASSILEGCEIAMLIRVERDEQIFEPAQIRSALSHVGFDVRGMNQERLPLDATEPDEELWLVERVMRTFLRANQVNEDLIRTKLGVRAAQFFDDVLPSLLRVGILEVIPYLGHGSQRRFKMRVQMQKLHDALAECGGDFQRFLTLLAKP